MLVYLWYMKCFHRSGGKCCPPPSTEIRSIVLRPGRGANSVWPSDRRTEHCCVSEDSVLVRSSDREIGGSNGGRIGSPIGLPNGPPVDRSVLRPVPRSEERPVSPPIGPLIGPPIGPPFGPPFGPPNWPVGSAGGIVAPFVNQEGILNSRTIRRSCSGR